MRTLALTSPLMRGQDVRNLQHVLNERLQHYRSRTRVAEDGIYGPTTAHALANIGWIMGLEPPYGRIGVQMLVIHAHLRSPAEIRRGQQREKERSDHSAGGGLTSVPLIAARYVGVHESPSGSNWGYPYPAKWEENFGFNSGVSWCGCFAGSMVLMAGGHVTSRVAFCPYIEADARTGTGGFDRWANNHSDGVGPGWLVLYNWNGGSEPEHVGIVKAVHPEYIETVEGNTGGSNPSDGGMVAIERRSYSFTVGYARPRF